MAAVAAATVDQFVVGVRFLCVCVFVYKEMLVLQVNMLGAIDF